MWSRYRNMRKLFELSSQETDECIIWPYGKTWDGYPKIKEKVRGVVYWRRGNRLVLKRKLGRDIDPDKCAIHSCDKPDCINPRHIDEGTKQENSKDMMRKGRGRGQRSFYG